MIVCYSQNPLFQSVHISCEWNEKAAVSPPSSGLMWPGNRFGAPSLKDVSVLNAAWRDEEKEKILTVVMAGCVENTAFVKEWLQQHLNNTKAKNEIIKAQMFWISKGNSVPWCTHKICSDKTDTRLCKEHIMESNIHHNLFMFFALPWL